jgi:hypothetical protein
LDHRLQDESIAIEADWHRSARTAPRMTVRRASQVVGYRSRDPTADYGVHTIVTGGTNNPAGS